MELQFPSLLVHQLMSQYKKVTAPRQLIAPRRHKSETGTGSREDVSKKPVSRRRTPSQEDVLKGLRSSGTSGGLERKEAARIAARSYEGLKQRKLSEKGEKSGRQPPGRSNSSTSTYSSLSSSSADYLSQPPPLLTDLPPPSVPPAKSFLSSSHQVLSTSLHQQPRSSKRPLSHIFVAGASSYSDVSTDREEHARLVNPKSSTKHPSDKSLGVVGADVEERGVPRSGELRSMTARGLHLSMDSGIASGRKPPSSSSALGASWGGSTSRLGYESDGAARRRSTGGETASLPRPGSTSILPLTGAPPPSTFLNRSLTRSAERVNQPTFEPFGGRLAPRRSTSFSRLDSATVDELSTQVADLQERVTVLSMQFIYERDQLFQQLQRAGELMRVCLIPGVCVSIRDSLKGHLPNQAT